jgi:transposase
VRTLLSFSIEGETMAHHFSGREPLKDFDYLGRQIAAEQERLTAIGKKSSMRLSQLHRDRRVRIEHLWRAIAKRLVSLCRRHRIGNVALGWPKDILRAKRYGSGTWAERIHNFWSFDIALNILIGSLRRAGINAIRVGERGSSSTCIHDDPNNRTHHVVRSPRAWITCKTCALRLHSDQVGSRNIARFSNPNVRWDRPEAGPRTVTYRWNFQRWEAIPNPLGTIRLPKTYAA